MSMTFTYSTYTLVLPNPEFGNTDTYNPNAIVRQNRHKEAIVYKDVNWPTIITRFFNFKNLSLSLVQQLEIFFDVAIGYQVQLVDHNADTWLGYIVTDDPEIITIEDNCLYDVQFEFMGEKQ